MTGAGSGLGLDIARELAARGATVVAIDARTEAAGAVADGAGREVDFAVCDVTNPDVVATTFAGVLERHGRIDVLVNSAGIRDVSPALDLDAEQWGRVLAVNLTGSFLCAQAAGAAMVAQGGGSIVMISSVAGVVGVAERVAYTTTKHGVIGLMKALTAEWGASGVRVNTVCPGMTVTPLTADYATEEGMLESVRRVVPAGRVGEPQDITDVVLFLAGDHSQYVNGVAIPVDGGFTAVRQYDVLGRSENWANRT
ncbi:SDR family oxidoreductase [Nocardioides cavernae]|nr:SDR family oxidoreductase [Nocardioides cavernae]